MPVVESVAIISISTGVIADQNHGPSSVITAAPQMPV